jgi:hypothetical protein
LSELERAAELFEFAGAVGGAPLRHRVEIGRGRDDHRMADANPRSTGDPGVDTGGAQIGLRRGDADQFAGRLGVGDHPGELRRNGDQERFLALVEAPPLLLLDDQDTEHIALVDDRGAQKGAEFLFPRFREIGEAGMRLGVFEVDRLGAAGDQPHQTLVGRHRHLADRLGQQAAGGGQNIAIGGPVEQIDGAHAGVHGLLDALDDDLEDGGEIRRGVDLLDDAAQRLKHGGDAPCRSPGPRRAVRRTAP